MMPDASAKISGNLPHSDERQASGSASAPSTLVETPRNGLITSGRHPVPAALATVMLSDVESWRMLER
jgi:hypothetical protein